MLLAALALSAALHPAGLHPPRHPVRAPAPSMVAIGRGAPHGQLRLRSLWRKPARPASISPLSLSRAPPSVPLHAPSLTPRRATRTIKVTTASIPVGVADSLAESISLLLERLDAPRWVRLLNFAHLSSMGIAAHHACGLLGRLGRSRLLRAGSLRATLLCISALAMSLNFLGLVLDNGVLAAGRSLQASDHPLLADGRGTRLVKRLTKWRAGAHGVCVSLLPLPIMSIARANGLVDDRSLLPWMGAAAAGASLALLQWAAYDTSALTEVQDRAAAARGRGVHSFTTGKVFEMVFPAVMAMLLMLAVGVLSVSRGHLASGGLCMAGALSSLVASSFRVQALDNYGEIVAYVLLTGALVVAEQGLLAAHLLR
ncbi:hypothetical protein AB1Y20_005607 [Prymnesium parvum]|uniref:Uncharacterized protein n=1 Tax=Prymnesium parvum TaxID=97485 RepID=A0AB34J7P4_PRYPA